MALILCHYLSSGGKVCLRHNIPIAEAEELFNATCCVDCHLQKSYYTGHDRTVALQRYVREMKDLSDLELNGRYGFECDYRANYCDDMYTIRGNAVDIINIQRKNWEYIWDWQFCALVEVMMLLNYRVPKGAIKRRARLLRRWSKADDNWDLGQVEHFRSDFSDLLQPNTHPEYWAKRHRYPSGLEEILGK